MTREQIKSYMELFKAYSEGKEIEVIVPCEKGWKWVPAKELHLNELGSYRIKPEPRLRPYIIPKEILNAVKEHGPYLQSKASGAYRMITHISHRGLNVVLSNEDPGRQHSTEDLLSTYTWQDGTPCGILN